MEKERDLLIDIIKGFGIICMVAGHAGFPFTSFIYLFHMAIFFIASGYCFKDSNSESINSLKCFYKRKFITLWFPYVLWTTIYTCLHNFFIKINIYTDNPVLSEYVTGGYNTLTEKLSVADMVKNIVKSFFLGGGYTNWRSILVYRYFV